MSGKKWVQDNEAEHIHLRVTGPRQQSERLVQKKQGGFACIILLTGIGFLRLRAGLVAYVSLIIAEQHSETSRLAWFRRCSSWLYLVSFLSS